MKKGTVTRWKKPFAALLGAVLVLGAVCGAGGALPEGVKEALPEEVRETVEPITAQASGNDKAMSPGAEVLKTTSNTADAQIVHFGGNEWYVIGYGGSGVASAATNLTLIAKENLKTGVSFNPSSKPINEYSGSNLQNEVDTIANNLPEKNYIATRDLAVGTYNGINTDGVAGTAVTGAILWPLSTKEADGMNQELRKASDYWWLRSPGNGGDRAAFVYGDGYGFSLGDIVTNTYGVRPAFNLNLSSVIFTSAAVGGKSSGAAGAGALTAVSAMQNLPNTTTEKQNEWKLTLLDDGTITGLSSHSGFSVTGFTLSGSTVTVNVSGAKSGPNEYISAIVKESSGNIKSYGRVADCSSSAPTSVDIDLGGKFASGDQLFVFSEQYNGDYKTDYASSLKQVEPLPAMATVNYDLNGKPGTAPADESVFVGYTAIKPADPVVTGYRLDGWYQDAACSDGKKWDFSKPVDGIMTLYAKWTAHAYTVVYNNNGGLGSMPAQSREYNDGVVLTENTFTNGTFPFTGWNTKPDGTGTAYADKAKGNLTDTDGATVTLYAMWNLAQITTNSLSDGTERTAYQATLTTSGTTAPVTWTLVSGTLPDGLNLDGANGIISGTPSKAGSYTFKLQATDSAATPNVLSKEYTVTIAAKSSPSQETKTDVKGFTAADIPQTLKDAGYDTPEKIEEALLKVVVSKSGAGAQGTPGSGHVLLEVKLMVSFDGGATWTEATRQNFPAEGVKAVLPYPSGTGKETHVFSVVHMFTEDFRGHKPGETESPAVTLTDNGIEVVLDGLSPVLVSWEERQTSPPPTPTPDPAPTDPCPYGHASFHWVTVRAADEHNDGEMAYVCSACGHELYRALLSGYGVFQKNTADKIRTAAQGATVSVSTKRWISFNREVMDALAARPDVTLNVSFLDGGYRGNRFAFTIPAGTDVKALWNEEGYAGFKFLGGRFGLRPGT